MKVTNYAVGKWAKGGLLIFFGLILLIYWGQVMEELRPAFERLIGGQATFLNDLINALMWIIILWCFVDAAINILMSFREQKLSLDDIGAKLDAIEAKIAGQTQPKEAAKKPIVVEQGNIGKEPVQAAAPVDTRLAPPLPPPP